MFVCPLAASSALIETFGRLHVAIVHFPIALIAVAGVLEAWRLARKQTEVSSGTRVCLTLGAIAAVLSALTGWAHKAEVEQGVLLFRHQWLGIAATILSVALAVVYHYKVSIPKRLATVTVVIAVLVGLTGHMGGELTHGKGYLLEAFFRVPEPTVKEAKVVNVSQAGAPADNSPFARDVRPILVNSCYECHSSAKRRGGLRLDFKSAAFKGGNTGPAIVPGKPLSSPLLTRVIGDGDKKKMPLNKPPLTEAQIKVLREWIASGAEWPEAGGVEAQPERPHWAFVKPVRPALPNLKDNFWPKNAVDYFILNRLEKEGIKPSPEADKATLCRRLYLDLVGLPPSPEEVDAFVNDSHFDAYERLVDKLLDSPHYGERWGRHWLDLARYADTNGYEKDNVRSIWPYRDWVINALNKDMPFDQFVIEQLAGDMLPNPTPEQIIATGFHRNSMINEEGGIDVEEFRYKAVVDRVQTTSTALLGLTLQCAQCHDHKYDPFTQKEYFQFFAMLNNADEPTMDIKLADITAKRAEIETKIKTLESKYADSFPTTRPTVNWVLPNVAATQPSKGGAKFFVDDDDATIFVSGKLPKTDEYEIKLSPVPPSLTQLKLQVLTDPELPKAGPGRQGGDNNGNFVLTEIQAFAIPADGKRTPIKFASATADYAQPGFEVTYAIDGKEKMKGWAVDPLNGSPHTNHTAIFKLGERVPAGTQTLLVRLQQHYPEHTLGKFRLSFGVAPASSTQPTTVARTKFLEEQQAEWEKSVAPLCAHWTVLDPTTYHRSHDGTIEKMDDKSLLFTGDGFYKDQCAIEFSPDAVKDLKKLTGVRLEVLPDESLPKGGPGRNFAGGFRLSEFELHQMNLAPTSRPTTKEETDAGLERVDLDGRRMPLIDATANENPAGAAMAIDGKRDTHWVIGAGGDNRPRIAVFNVKDGITVDPQTRLGVLFLQNSYQNESVGRVRISVTTDATPKASGLPADIEQAIVTPAATRTDADKALIRNYFLSVTPFLDEQHQEVAALRRTLPGYPTSMVMHERINPRVTRIHHRGEYLQPEKPVDAALPEVLGTFSKDQKADRLNLAKWIVSSDDPLTARVTMNRVWSQYFGRGIVSSVDDFGTTGQLPSHPELLDYLATEFIHQGWSMKKMHRLIVTSATYRQSSTVTPELQQKDPANTLFARGPGVRVEAEIVRDVALTAGGLLSEKIGGPSVFPPQPAGVTALSYGPLAWTTSAGEDRYRRGIYTFLKRTQPYPGLATFDAPTADLTCPRRPRSNTPLQALTTLNDEVYVEAARGMGKRLQSLNTDLPSKVKYAFKVCVAREPTREEMGKIIAFYAEQSDRLKRDTKTATTLTSTTQPTAETSELAAWTLVSRALLNLDETITKE